jgi:hypothetical protein
MAYIFPGEGSLNYYLCQYGGSKIQCRGPKQATDAAYIAFLGGTETYGRFVQTPFATLLGRGLALPAVNLAAMNAGPDLYLNAPELLQIAAQAQVTVVQIMGAQNISNRYYSVHPRRNDRFLAASPLLMALFPRVDFTEFNFTRHMLMALQAESRDRFEVVAEELRAAWVVQMKRMLATLNDRTILLWMSECSPPQPERRAQLQRLPMLIDAEMIAAIRPLAAQYLEANYSPTAVSKGREGMAFAPMEAIAASEVPGPAVHQEVAAKLMPMITALLGR